MDGKRPQVCGNCWIVESSGGRSYRHSSQDSFKLTAQKAQESASLDPLPVEYLDIQLGNRCNLRCRMCSPHASHLLQKEFELLNLAPPLYADANFDWPASEKVWEDIWQMVPALKKLSFGEGEPFINKPGLAFLRKLQESGHASHIDLIIDTNMTMLLPKHYEFFCRVFDVAL